MSYENPSACSLLNFHLCCSTLIREGLKREFGGDYPFLFPLGVTDHDNNSLVVASNICSTSTWKIIRILLKRLLMDWIYERNIIHFAKVTFHCEENSPHIWSLHCCYFRHEVAKPLWFYYPWTSKEMPIYVIINTIFKYSFMKGREVFTNAMFAAD